LHLPACNRSERTGPLFSINMKFLAAIILISLAFAAADDICATGKNQSPINIQRNATHCVKEGEDWARKYTVHRYYMPNIWRAVTYTAGPAANTFKAHFGAIKVGGSCASCEGTMYRAIGFSFKTPAEHLVHGKQYPLEVQILHQREDKTEDYVVNSVFFYQQPDGGFPNSFIAAASPSNKNTDTLIDLSALREAFHGEYFHYKGSQTSPPCAENVHWNIYRTPLGITADQLTGIKAGLQANARAVQPQGDRKVTWVRRLN